MSLFSVRTRRACELLSLSAETLLRVLHGHRYFGVALAIAQDAVAQAEVIGSFCFS